MSADQAQPPSACSLQPTELSDRRADWERLSKRALRERRPLPSGIRLVFADEDGAESELRELARLEGRCCSFADWNVERRDHEVVLDVTAPREAVAAVRALFDGRYHRQVVNLCPQTTEPCHDRETSAEPHGALHAPSGASARRTDLR